MSSKPSSYWRLKPFLYRLEGSRCVVCGHFHPHIRKVCRRCGSRRLERDLLPRTGRIKQFTVVHQPSPGLQKNVPHMVAWVEMDDGTQLVGQITDADPDQVRPGMTVETVVRKIKAEDESRLIVYGVKFRPLV